MSIHLASELVSSDELMSDGDPSNIEMINLLISRNAQEQEERLKEIKESPLYSCMQQTPTLTITSQVGRWRIYLGFAISYYRVGECLESSFSVGWNNIRKCQKMTVSGNSRKCP